MINHTSLQDFIEILIKRYVILSFMYSVRHAFYIYIYIIVFITINVLI